uniref:XLR/SYCP3/FAM9 domain-containing protein n=1 Tax=Urocitellus parryii TaxID=9999 RepID=A0A8D2I0A0_UROPR
MAPTARKSLRRAAKAQVQPQDLSVYDFECPGETLLLSQGSLQRGGSALGIPVSEVFPSWDIKKLLQAKRRNFKMSISASVKTFQQKIEHVLKIQHEQREELYEEYSQQFATLVQMWNLDVKKVKEQGEKLGIFQQQQKAFQQSQFVQSQKMKAFRELCEQYLESLQDLEENHGNVLAGEHSELRKQMAILQTKLMMESRQEEKASARKSLLSLLFS